MSAPPDAFTALEDRLLKGGIAPRHVRRYLRELADHLADLTDAQIAAGHDGDTAAARARAALGPDDELAHAMLGQKRFRSVSARFPLLVFSLAPPLVMAIGTAVPVLLIALLGKLAIALSLIERGNVEPHGLQLAVRALLETGNLLAMPLAVLMMVVIVWRQRLSPAWLLLSLAMLWPLILCATIEFPATEQIARKSGAALALGAGISTNGILAQDKTSGLFVLAYYTLALLPIGWLLLRRRALAKVPFPS